MGFVELLFTHLQWLMMKTLYDVLIPFDIITDSTANDKQYSIL